MSKHYLKQTISSRWQQIILHVCLTPITMIGVPTLTAVFAAENDQPQSFGEIKARSFVIRDVQGRGRASLQFAPRGKESPHYSSPAIQLWGPDGQVRFDFGLDDQRDAPVLRIVRADGQTGLFLSSDTAGNVVAFEPRGKKSPAILMQTWPSKTGNGVGGTIEFFNPRGIPQVGLAVWPDDSSGLRLYDPRGVPYEPGNPPASPAREPMVSLSQPPVRPALQREKSDAKAFPALEADAFLLLDDHDRVRAIFGLLREDDKSYTGAALEFYDVKGTPRANMVFDENQDCVSVTLGDGAGNSAVRLTVSPDGPLLKLFSPQQEKSMLVSLGNPRGRKPGASGVNLTGSDGAPRVIFGERPRGGGMLGASDRTGKKPLFEVH